MRRRLGVLACVSWLALAGSAHAADDKAVREAQTRFHEGLARVKAGDFEAARRSFAQAYAVLHKPDILWNLALSEQKSGHKLEALSHFRELQRDFPPGPDRADAAKHLSELAAETGHLEINAAPGSQVTVDGEPRGSTPLDAPVDVLPGRHHVEVRPVGGPVKAADADAAAGQVARVSFLMGDPVPPPAPAPAVAPATAPATATPEAPPPPAPATDATFWDARGITVVTLGGLAVVGAGMGLAFGLVSLNDQSTANTLRQQNPSCGTPQSAGCAQLASTVQSQHDAFVVSEVAWISAGVLAAGSLGALLFWPRAQSTATSGVRLVPAVGGGMVGGVAAGSF